MKVLAVDLGSHLGLAWRARGDVRTQQINLPAGGGRHGQRCAIARSQFLALLASVNPDAVAYERPPSLRGRSAVRVLFAMEAILLSVCEELRIPYVEVKAAAVKEALTGRPSSPKEAVQAAAEELLGRVLASDDEADAFGVLLCAEGLPASVWGVAPLAEGGDDAGGEAVAA